MDRRSFIVGLVALVGIPAPSSAAAPGTIEGLAHLEGRTVIAFAEGETTTYTLRWTESLARVYGVPFKAVGPT